jgi:hypothetical protein
VGRTYLNSAFGDTDSIRLQNQVACLNRAGYGNITFKLFAGVGHDSRPMEHGVLAFFDGHR